MVSDSSSTVFLLRSASEPDSYLAAFEAAGLYAECVPVLRFTFPHQDRLIERLQSPEKYGGLIVTSPRAVRALRRAWGTEVDRTPWLDKPAYAVGPQTASALRDEGLQPQGQESGSAVALVSVIAKKNEPLLFLSGNRRRDTLPDGLTEAGIAFEEQEVYQTHTRTDIELPDARPGDWLAFFSPSGLEAIQQSSAVDSGHFRIAAIGPTTASALEEEGLTVEAVAARPAPEALVKAIQAAA